MFNGRALQNDIIIQTKQRRAHGFTDTKSQHIYIELNIFVLVHVIFSSYTNMMLI